MPLGIWSLEEWIEFHTMAKAESETVYALAFGAREGGNAGEMSAALALLDTYEPPSDLHSAWSRKLLSPLNPDRGEFVRRGWISREWTPHQAAYLCLGVEPDTTPSNEFVSNLAEHLAEINAPMGADYIRAIGDRGVFLPAPFALYYSLDNERRAYQQFILANALAGPQERIWTFRKRDGFLEIGVNDGPIARMKWLAGFEKLRELLRKPGKSFSPEELVGNEGHEKTYSLAAVSDYEDGDKGSGGNIIAASVQPGVEHELEHTDSKAIRELRESLEKNNPRLMDLMRQKQRLDAELKDAEDEAKDNRHDPEMDTDRYLAESNLTRWEQQYGEEYNQLAEAAVKLKAYLANNTRRGRIKATSQSGENARTNTLNQIKAAVERIRVTSERGDFSVLSQVASFLMPGIHNQISTANNRFTYNPPENAPTWILD